MTFERLCRRLNKRLNRKDWHKHKNGKGWVQNTTYIEKHVYVGPNALVMDTAKLYDKVTIKNYAIVCGSTTLRNNVEVSGFAKVSEYAVITGDASIQFNAHVYGFARIFGYAIVSDNAKVSGICNMLGRSFIGGRANLSGDYQIRGRMDIREDARISGSGYINGDNLSIISGDSTIATSYSVIKGKVITIGSTVLVGSPCLSGLLYIAEGVWTYNPLSIVVGNVIFSNNATGKIDITLTRGINSSLYLNLTDANISLDDPKTFKWWTQEQGNNCINILFTDNKERELAREAIQHIIKNGKK